MNFEKLKIEHPWPEVSPTAPRFWETYTGQGKSIIVEKMIKENLTTILEIGSFFGASVDFFLNAVPGARIVAVDPWGSGWAGNYIKSARYNDAALLSLSEEKANFLDQGDGFYEVFIASMARYKNRLIPIRLSVQEAIPFLIKSDFKPDVVYLDADKNYEGLKLVYQSFPDAVISGDDYRWKDGAGTRQMRDSVERLSFETNRPVIFHDQTWMIV